MMKNVIGIEGFGPTLNEEHSLRISIVQYKLNRFYVDDRADSMNSSRCLL